MLVKSIFKTRPWWGFRNSGEIEGCQFVWTEWKRNKSMAGLAKAKERAGEMVGGCQPIVNCNGKDKDKKEKKLANFANVIGKHAALISKYDPSPTSHSYLTFTAKTTPTKPL